MLISDGMFVYFMGMMSALSFISSKVKDIVYILYHMMSALSTVQDYADTVK